jgi:hypothetical protein
MTHNGSLHIKKKRIDKKKKAENKKERKGNPEREQKFLYW